MIIPTSASPTWVKSELAKKQDKLAQGDGIAISNNVVSVDLAEATQTSSGLMSAQDKKNLDTLKATAITEYVKDVTLNSYSLKFTKSDGTTVSPTLTAVSVTASTDNKDHPLLMMTGTTAANGYTGTYAAAGVTVNPSAKAITATKFYGALEGTADKAVADADGNAIASTYAKKNEIPDTSGLATKAEIPDVSGFAKKSDIPDVSGFAKKSDIPDVSGFATKSEVNLLPTFEIKVVSALPTSGISTKTMYLVPSDHGINDQYDQYIYVNSQWEKIGSGIISVDSALSSTSPNPVQNKVIFSALSSKLDATGTAARATADGDGNNIASTYAKTSDIPTAGNNITITGGVISATDSKVWQQSSATDGAFPLLFKTTNNGNNESGLIRFNSGVTVNPKTGHITATAFDGTASRATADAEGNNIATAYLKVTGGTLTGELTVKGKGVITGGSDVTSYNGFQATRKCVSDGDYVNTAGFIINADGASKFIHRRGTITAEEDAFFQFDALGFKLVASGTKGVYAPFDTLPIFEATTGAIRPKFKGSDIALSGDIPNISGLATKGEIPDVSNFITKTDLQSAGFLPLTGGTLTGDLTIARTDDLLGTVGSLTLGDKMTIGALGGMLLMGTDQTGVGLDNTTFSPVGDVDLGSTSLPWKAIYGSTIYQNGVRVATVDDLEGLGSSAMPTTYVKSISAPGAAIVVTNGDDTTQQISVSDVVQIESSSTNAELSLLTTNSRITSTGTRTVAETRFSNAVTLNPSTGAITATSFKGTADKAVADADGNAIASTYAKASALDERLPNFINKIGNTNAGNPRQVKFISVNYSTKATYFKMSAASCHDNGVSYQFLEDIIIGVTTSGTVTCNLMKYCQIETSALDGVVHNYGDVFYTNDTTNKVVDFYILMGQYSLGEFTPPTKIGNTTLAYVTPLTGSPVYYSSGEKVWAHGNDALIATTADLPRITISTEPPSGGQDGDIWLQYEE